jgi:UDP-glucose 4-epimerase
LTVFGTDYPTPDGTCLRDYVHVADLVDAHVLGLNWLLDGRGTSAFNLGSGKGFSVRAVIDAAASVTNRAVPILNGPRRAGDAVALVSGSTRAREVLGWKPKRSTLAQMIHDAAEWGKGAGFLR